MSPTFLNVGINFLVNQLLDSGPDAEVSAFTVVGLLKFNKWVGEEEEEEEEELAVKVVCAQTLPGKAALG